MTHSAAAFLFTDVNLQTAVAPPPSSHTSEHHHQIHQLCFTPPQTAATTSSGDLKPQTAASLPLLELRPTAHDLLKPHLHFVALHVSHHCEQSPHPISTVVPQLINCCNLHLQLGEICGPIPVRASVPIRRRSPSTSTTIVTPSHNRERPVRAAPPLISHCDISPPESICLKLLWFDLSSASAASTARLSPV